MGRPPLQDHPVAAEWAEDLNGGPVPANLTQGSRRRAWWRCADGHVWEAEVKNRARIRRPTGCPNCGRMPPLTTLPIASEWAEDLNEGPIPEELTQGSHQMAWWRCAEGHEWESRVYHRTDPQRPRGCPACAQCARSSAPERALMSALGLSPAILPVAWGWDVPTADVDGYCPRLRAVVELDGWYWHGTVEQRARDTTKTTALLRAGFKVVRVREVVLGRPMLTPLPISSPDYAEIPAIFDGVDFDALAFQVMEALVAMADVPEA